MSSKQTKQTKEQEIEQLNKLKKLYYDPKRGLTGLNQLYLLAKDNNIKLTQSKIKQWYDDQAVNQVYRSKPKKQVFKIECKTQQPGCIQADLKDVSRFANKNKGMKYLLNIVDVYSRFAWVFPIKTKTTKEIAPHIRNVLEEIKQFPMLTFTSDEGNEFLGEVNKVLKDYDVKRYKTSTEEFGSKNRTSLVERFNRTIQNLMKRYMVANDTLNYIDILPDLVKNYNDTYHVSIKDTPSNIFKHPEKKKFFFDLTKPIERETEDEFEIGDWVRHEKQRKTFDKKGFVENYSIKLYQIKEKRGNKYLLSNGKLYFPHNLIKADKEKHELKKLKPELKQAIKEKQFEKEKRKEVTSADVAKFVVEGKRERKKKTFGEDFV